jgi:hypothetical protein
MTLEIEKLRDAVSQMVQSTVRSRRKRLVILEKALERLQTQAPDWQELERCLDLAINRAGLKKLRAARPLNDGEPLDTAVDPPELPSQATTIASDGSQIMPDRHAAYLYSLVNVGIFVYFYGQKRTPLQATAPWLDYPDKDNEAHASPGSFHDEAFPESSAAVGLRRDRAEIEILARTAWEHNNGPKPLLAILDQRLLYWPAVSVADQTGSRVVDAWQEAMNGIRASDGLLAGYITRSRKQSVLTMLDTLEIESSNFELSRLTERDTLSGLSDTALFGRILSPGQRSKVFIDVSQHNEDFRSREPLNEICFFYLNPGLRRRPDSGLDGDASWTQVARVDMPMWVAQDPAAVANVHALIYDQCCILGNYPYALTRADELAVVGRSDQENLNVMIENAMQRQDITRFMTAKQSTKHLARASRTRHEI